VTHKGEFETVTAAGIAPRPVQQPIPLWFGGSSAPAYRRIGRLGDGWFPQVQPGPDLDAARHLVDDAATRVGRDPAAIGLEGSVGWTGSAEAVAESAQAWQAAGASHIAINTSRAGLSTSTATSTPSPGRRRPLGCRLARRSPCRLPRQSPRRPPSGNHRTCRAYGPGQQLT
jgi:alkanesulfonate monooxygenase SsuD/methylene tetrahydromethanopterin reductase-like flavin-dependent oxidoreductase (luciferase family)